MKDKQSDIIYTIKLFGICVLFCAVIAALSIVFNSYLLSSSSQAFSNGVVSEIIIDAGHGGRDGGAIGINGAVEKELNLSVAVSLNDILKLCGVTTVMTRENDKLVCDESDPALKGKIKITDLKNRLKIASEYPNASFVSIHMNNFSVEKYSGLQVYYSPNNEKSFVLAKSLQDNVCKVLQSDNNRKVKKAGSGIFLLDRLQIPAILIECGFLSNTKEAELLTNPTYQSALTIVIADSLLANLT